MLIAINFYHCITTYQIMMKKKIFLKIFFFFTQVRIKNLVFISNSKFVKDLTRSRLNLSSKKKQKNNPDWSQQNAFKSV